MTVGLELENVGTVRDRFCVVQMALNLLSEFSQFGRTINATLHL